MKHFLPLLLFVLSCNQKSKVEIVKENIRIHLSKTMHDFKSYEPVEYGKIDSLYSSYNNTSSFLALKNLFNEYHKEFEEALQSAKDHLYISRSTGKYYSNRATAYADKLDSIAKLMKSEASAFNPKFIGFKILHSFRGKNMNGATIITTEYFIFDSLLNVISTEEMPKEKEED